MSESTAAAPPAEPATPPASDSGASTGESTEPSEGGEFSRDYVEKLRRENARYRTQVRELEPKAAKADELEQANATENERAVTAAKAETEKATAEKYRGLLVQAEARALAAELKFRDPEDAVRLVDLADVEAGEDGAVDRESIRSVLRTVADKKPYLIEAAPVPSPADAGIGVTGAPGSDYGNLSVSDMDKELFGSQ
ncbi:hypothetical protein [Streptomonospora salina]|uniref:Scaffolding protein n=1 Tax=Streptomonospora salina TaxID=104205 RepID=A0A841ELE2_9ACTN|nr:hypothetical protein [Streptomonospora salina]MBB6000221.1 hypothetical protein [Streptomonospora salina]